MRNVITQRSLNPKGITSRAIKKYKAIADHEQSRDRTTRDTGFDRQDSNRHA